MNKIFDVKRLKSSYEIKKIEPNMISELFTKMENGLGFFWMHNEILIGKIESGNISFLNNKHPNFEYHLIKARVFNDNREVHVFKRNGNFFSRSRIDNESSNGEQFFFDSNQYVEGTFKELNDGWAKFSNARGIELIIPAIPEKSTNRLKLKIRNYITFNKIGQVSIVDMRYVQLKTVKEDL